jgi:hypothetical protein
MVIAISKHPSIGDLNHNHLATNPKGMPRGDLNAEDADGDGYDVPDDVGGEPDDENPELTPEEVDMGHGVLIAVQSQDPAEVYRAVCDIFRAEERRERDNPPRDGY